MYNQITVVGHLTRDTEIFITNAGVEILNGSLAINDPFRPEHVDFIDIVAFNKLALNTNQYTKKGSKILVSGKLQQNKWENDDGQKRSKHEIVANQIVFLDTKQDIQDQAQSQRQNNQNTQGQQQSTQAGSQAQGEPIDISDNMLPF